MSSNSLWKPTRRTILRSGAAAAAVATLPGLGAAPGFAAASCTPKRGGTLRVGYSQGGVSDSLDPATYTSDPTYAIGWLLGNNLVELTPNKEPIPELAESWEGSKDAKTWTFKLRTDVKFTNGKPLVAADVIYSIKRHMAADSKSAAKGLLEGIADIRADGDHTVVVENKAGNVDTPIVMADYHLQIVPEGFNDWTTFIGTGPYILDKWEPGVRLTAHRNPDYWKKDRAWFDDVVFIFINDAAARANALTTDQVDAADRIEPKIVQFVEKDNRLKIVKTVGSTYNASAMDVRDTPFKDNNVRMAIKLAVDRKAMIDTVYSGFAEVGNDQPIPKGDPFFNSDLKQRVYDPDKAKWYLKQSGLSSVDITIHTANAAFTGAVDAAVMMQQQAKAAGINLTVKREPDGSYWSDVWMKKPYVMTYWGVRPTPGMMFALAFQCKAPWNEARWCNERFNKLLTSALQEMDVEKRKQMYWEMQEICADDGGNCIFAFPASLDGYSVKVQGVVPDLVRTMDGSRLAERAWFGDC